MMMLKLSVTCLTILLLMRFESVTCATSGGYSSPAGCTTNCTYKMTWYYNATTDMIDFTVLGREPIWSWVGIAFGADKLMQNTDFIYGHWEHFNGIGHVVDAYIDLRHSSPKIDTIQNVERASMNYSDGVYLMKFSRARVTNDTKQDISFNDTFCLYFKYPVGGGLMADTLPQKHTITPTVSDAPICVSAANSGSTAASGASSMGSAPPSPPSPPPSPPSPPPSGPSMPPSAPPSGPSMSQPSGASLPPSPPPSGPSIPPSPPPSPPSPPPSGASIPSGASTLPPIGSPPSVPSMLPSPPPSGPSMAPPSGQSMPPSPPPSAQSPSPSGPSMPPSPPPSDTREPPIGYPSSAQPGVSTNPPTNGGGDSSRTTRITIIATLVVFGVLSAIVLIACLCFTSSAAVSGFRNF